MEIYRRIGECSFDKTNVPLIRLTKMTEEIRAHKKQKPWHRTLLFTLRRVNTNKSKLRVVIFVPRIVDLVTVNNTPSVKATSKINAADVDVETTQTSIKIDAAKQVISELATKEQKQIIVPGPAHSSARPTRHFDKLIIMQMLVEPENQTSLLTIGFLHLGQVRNEIKRPDPLKPLSRAERPTCQRYRMRNQPRQVSIVLASTVLSKQKDERTSQTSPLKTKRVREYHQRYQQHHQYHQRQQQRP